MIDLSHITRIVELLVANGPGGIIVAGLLVGIVIAIILYSRAKNLFDDAGVSARGKDVDAKVSAFQSDILTELKATRDREKALAQSLDVQRTVTERLLTQMALYREATARLIAQLRLLKAGKIGPGDIEIPELPQ